MGEEVERRDYIKILGGVIGGLVIGATIGYLAKPAAPAEVITKTVEKTVPGAIETVTAPGVTTTVEKTVEKTITKTVAVPLKPFEGETIVVAPHAIPHAYAHYRSRDKFKELTGIGVEVVEMVVEEMYEKHMAEFIAKTGAYDVIQFNPAWIADYSKYLEPLEPLADKYGLYLNTADIIATWRDMYCSWGGVMYGMVADGDTHLLYTRKDLFEHPDEMDAFERKYGYKLRAPTTLDEYKDVAEFFTRKKGETLAGKTLDKDFYGHAEYLGRGRMYWWFLWRFGALAGKRAAYFDGEMNPLINTDEAIAALQHTVDTVPYAPPGVLDYTYMELRTAYVKGDIGMCYQWTCVGKAAEDPAESLILGNTSYSLGPRPMIAGGWVLGIPADSKHKGAAITYLQFVCSPEQSLWIVKQPDITYDPWRYSHFKDPGFRAAWAAAGEYLDAIIDSVESGFPDLQIPGAASYMDTLDEECCRCLAGEKDATTALNDAAKRWNEITDRLGRDAQREAWLAQLESFRKLGLVE